MSLTTLLLEIVLVGAGLYGRRRRHHWLFLFAITAGVVGSVTSFVMFVVAKQIWWFAPWDLALTPAVLAVAAFALAPALMSRPGWAEARSDRDLYASLVELGEILNNGPTQQDRAVVGAWITQAHQRALSVLHTLERMKAPSREWSELLAAYIELTKRTVAAIPSGVTPDQRRLMAAEGAQLARRYEKLRAASRERSDVRPESSEDGDESTTD